MRRFGGICTAETLRLFSEQHAWWGTGDAPAYKESWDHLQAIRREVPEVTTEEVVREPVRAFVTGPLASRHDLLLAYIIDMLGLPAAVRLLPASVHT